MIKKTAETATANGRVQPNHKLIVPEIGTPPLTKKLAAQRKIRIIAPNEGMLEIIFWPKS
jgi:hypothetical protein